MVRVFRGLQRRAGLLLVLTLFGTVFYATQHRHDVHRLPETSDISSAKITASQRSALALALAVLGGAAMGSYPVFLKTQPVLRAAPHPLVFQLYKSAIVFATAWIFLIPRWWSRPAEEPLLVWSKWGLAAAAFWIPSGLGTIFAVQRLGMGLTMAINAATGSTASFVAFVALFGTRIREYSCGEGCTFTLAPVYLLATLLGIVAMVSASSIATKLGIRSRSGHNGLNRQKLRLSDASLVASNTIATETTTPTGSSRWWIGVASSLSAGLFAAVQWSAITVGQQSEQRQAMCLDDPPSCPAELREAFNVLGSWNVSFGTGAIVVTLALMFGREAATGERLDLHWPLLQTAGIYAGILWVVGNTLITLAVSAGGNAVVVAQAQSATIFFSGLHSFVTCEYKAAHLNLI